MHIRTGWGGPVRHAYLGVQIRARDCQVILSENGHGWRDNIDFVLFWVFCLCTRNKRHLSEVSVGKRLKLKPATGDFYEFPLDRRPVNSMS